MSNRTEAMYDLIFNSIKRILTQQKIYELEINTITINTEIVLINSIHNNFRNSKRIGAGSIYIRI